MLAIAKQAYFFNVESFCGLYLDSLIFEDQVLVPWALSTLPLPRVFTQKLLLFVCFISEENHFEGYFHSQITAEI